MYPSVCEICEKAPWSMRLVINKPSNKSVEIFTCQACGTDLANIKIILPERVEGIKV